MSMVPVDVIANSHDIEIVMRRSSTVFSFLERRNNVAFILDPDRRPTVVDLLRSAGSVDIRTLMGEDIQGGDPIYFSDVQMKAVRLLAELYFCIQGIKEDLIRSPETGQSRYPLETNWKLGCAMINADIANRWIAADLPDVDSPEFEVVIAFIN